MHIAYSRLWGIPKKWKSTAVLLEGSADGTLASSNRNAISAAKQLTDTVHGIALFPKMATNAHKLFGLTSVVSIKTTSDLRLAENITAALKTVDAKLKPDYWLSGHSAFGKNVMPRLAGALGIPCLSDITKIIDGNTFERPIYAGNAIASVRCDSTRMLLTVRGTAFEPSTGSQLADHKAEQEIQVDIEPIPSEYIQFNGSGSSKRPELSAARVVISGGRALKTKQDFDRVLGALADAIPGSALGASRAAVDAGLAPNDMQVGQTGKVVAPALYIAIGISGAIQHVAGMKESKVIVAINKDADCPIFQVADYGLTGDLFKLIPELTDKIHGMK